MREKEKRHIPVKRIPASILKDFPKCDFLEIKSEQEAKAFLEGLNNVELRFFVEEVEQAVSYNYVFNTVKTWIIDAEAQIRQYDERKKKRGFYIGCYNDNRRKK